MFYGDILCYSIFMIIRVIEDAIILDELREIAREYYVDMIKGVVDISKEIMAIGGEYHMDANMKILENGSIQADVWGFNIFLIDRKTSGLNLLRLSISARKQEICRWR